jgi:TATA-box binding protein (TBP) (component of TFIID and TFIIIB)
MIKHISNMNIPEIAPVPTPLKFVTMTMCNSLDKFINLWVLAKYYNPDIDSKCDSKTSRIVGIKFENIVRGRVKRKKKKKKRIVETKRKRFTDFKHQCTLIIDCLGKDINVKLFNNGRIVCTGCNNIEQAAAAAETISKALKDLEGELSYGIPTEFKSHNLKKTHKDDILDYTTVIELISYELDIDINLELFNPSMSKQDSYLLFEKELEADDTFEQDLSYILTLISILKTYYGDEYVKKAETLKDFGDLFDMLVEHSDLDNCTITMPFLSYLDNSKPIKQNHDNVRIIMINHTMSCNYSLNRVNLSELLDKDPRIKFVNYNKVSYSGVKAYYNCIVDRMEGKNNTITVIFFSSGKINITAARTFKQSDEVYKYITDLCENNFNELLMRSAYRIKKKEIENDMPDMFDLGVTDDNFHYVLVKKSSILKNPRNVNLLKNTFDLLDKYMIS